MPAPIQWDTVSVPFLDGISPATRDRLLPSTKLLVLENGFVFNQRSIKKRLGHVATRVKTQVANTPAAIPAPVPSPYRTPFSFDDPQTSPNWVFGYGLYQDQLSSIPSSTTAVSPQNEAGLLFGQLARDNETVTWDGFRSFSYTTSALLGESYAPPNRGSAIIPQLKVEPMAKVATAQLFPDASDNGTIRVVAWCNPDNVSYSYSVFDSATGACIVDTRTETLLSTKGLRVLTVGGYAHILIADRTNNTLELRSFHQNTPTTVASANFPTTINCFDVRKVDETQFLIAVANNTNANMFLRNLDGSSKNAYTKAAGAALAGVSCSAITYGSPTGALFYSTGASILGTQFDLYTGAQQGTTTTVTGTNQFQKFSVTGAFSGFAATRWDVFTHQFDVIGTDHLATFRVDLLAGTSSTVSTRNNIGLHSQAFSVGTKSFAWAYTRHTLQSTFYLVDMDGKPVGKMNYGTAVYASPSGPIPDGAIVMPGVSFTQNWGINLKDKDRYVWYGALGYKQRVENTNLTHGNPTGLFAEPSIKFYALDFLAPMRSAQAGRSTYVAGAQLWEYDGTEFNEAGFHMAPENMTFTTPSAGVLTGTYNYRVDLCYKNAQNEEVRSWSLIQPPQSPSAKKMTITINTIPCTRREDAYFLVYRTASNQNTFYLCSSRDPTVTGDNGFVKNDVTAQFVTFVDNITDATLLAREYHPANAGGNYLDPLPAPSCQVVAGGAGRLWLAGGELNPGELAPSRQFAVGETPAFHPAINLQVDRNIEPITAITFRGDIGVAFRRTSAYFIETDGPDNTLNPQVWQQPRIAIEELGAVSQESVISTSGGVWFQSTAGLRLLGPGGGIVAEMGFEVDPIATSYNIAATVLIPPLETIRFYSRDANKPTLVYNYTNNAWSTWTNTHCVGASYWPGGNKAMLSRADGNIWAETDGVFTDGGSPYEFRIKIAPQHAGSLGDFMRWRRFALFGLYLGPHTLRMRLFYNEEPFWHEEIIQQWPFTQAASNVGAFSSGNDAFGPGFSLAVNTPAITTSGWGDLTWGAGSWGDASNVSGGADLWFRNNVYRTRKRPKRQKCSVFSIEFSDCSAPNDSFSPVALGLELGRKTGLDRIPAPR